MNRQKRMEKFLEVARRVRSAMEKIATSRGYRKDTLAGLCAVASRHLYLEARRAGIRGVKMWRNWSHAFNEFDGHIVDLTATQFGHQERIFIHLIEGYDPPSYHYREIHIRTHMMCHFGDEPMSLPYKEQMRKLMDAEP